MKSTNDDATWLASKSKEIEDLSVTLKTLGFTLNEKQPHLSGERYLMTREKLVLSGRQIATGEHVIIKASKHPSGKKEIETEKHYREVLGALSFANKVLIFPAEIYFGEHNGSMIWITSYITQDKVFVAHTLEEQFFLTLRTFEAQEAFHATTFEHLQTIKNTFPILSDREYLAKFHIFTEKINKDYHDDKLDEVLQEAATFLKSHEMTIRQFSNHLVHQDFVPHNFRIKNRDVYMLDCSSVYFGNKYEGWARFLNYMLIHNPELEKLLVAYIRDNRGKDEYLSLRLMRVYKVGELLEYYARSLAKTTDNLHVLTNVRIQFWRRVMQALLKDTPLKQAVVDQYIATRNALRSLEEKERQREFAIA